jgi:hypothetical protein
MTDLLSQAILLAVPVAYLLLELTLVTLAARVQNDLVMRHLGRRVYMLLMWPGVAVHELSHAFACLITRTRLSEVNLFGPRRQGNQLVLGYVSHAEPRHSFQQVLIGTAPFFGGTAVLYGLTWAAFPAAAGLLKSTVSLGLNPQLYWQWLNSFVGRLGEAHFGWWQGFVVYLMFSVAAHVAPSDRDLKGTLLPLILMALALAVPLAVLYFFWAQAFLWISGQLGHAATVMTGLMAMALVGVTAGLAAVALAALMVMTFRRRFRRP